MDSKLTEFLQKKEMGVHHLMHTAASGNGHWDAWCILHTFQDGCCIPEFYRCAPYSKRGWSRCISSYSSYLIKKLDIINRRFLKIWRRESARNFRACGTAQLLVPWSFVLPPYIPDWIQPSPPFQKLAIQKCWWVKAKIGQEKPLFSQRTMKVTAWKDRKMIWCFLQIIIASS